MLKFILSTLSTSFIAISAVLVAIGWYQIRKGNRKLHKKLMISASWLISLFFVIYLSRTAFVGNVTFGGPSNMQMIYQIFLVFHIILATVAGGMGLITLRLALKERFAQHRRIGPWTSVIWFSTAITGVTVYLLLNIIYPHGETTGLIEAIFGK